MYDSRPGIAIITRKTRMQGLLARWSTRGQAKFCLKASKMQERARTAQQVTGDTLAEADEEYDLLASEDETYQRAVSRLHQAIDFGLPVQVVDREFVPNFDFARFEVVVVIGQDGLVANAAKYVGDVPIVAVNPDPRTIDGVLLPFKLADVPPRGRPCARKQVRHARRNAGGSHFTRWPKVAGFQRSVRGSEVARIGPLSIDDVRRPLRSAIVQRHHFLDRSGLHGMDVVGVQHGGRCDQLSRRHANVSARTALGGSLASVGRAGTVSQQEYANEFGDGTVGRRQRAGDRIAHARRRRDFLRRRGGRFSGVQLRRDRSRGRFQPTSAACVEVANWRAGDVSPPVVRCKRDSSYHRGTNVPRSPT